MNPRESPAHVQQPGDAAVAARLKQIKIFDKRWEVLKEVLEPLFQKETITTIASGMERRFHFRASEQQFKYRFRQWGWTGKKNSAQVPGHIKHETISRAQKRAARGKVTAAEYKGQVIHPHRLQSEIGTLSSTDSLTISEIFQTPILHSQHFGSYMPFSDRLLLVWNMPFGARPSASTPPWMRPSPSMPGDTPDGLIITTPADSAPTPSGTGLVRASKPSLMPAVRLQRTKLMAQGKFQDLLKTMDLAEQRTLSTWFYQYWFFSFITAQEWGRGPLQWSADLLKFADYGAIRSVSLTNTPHNDESSTTPGGRRALPGPPSTCRWSIHVDSEDTVEWLVEMVTEQDAPGNVWPQQILDDSMEQRLLEALQNNSFSDVTEAQLPVSVSKIVTAAQRSPSDLLLESLGFAIMGRNIDLVASCLMKANARAVDIATIHPLHIATSYLDGGKSCCLIISELCAFLMVQGRYKNCITNEHGHTILDNLFLSVLRSHSNAPLSIVDGSLGERARYAGIEVDICGRWSADSHCYRTLLASGERTIPSQWKHKFCHTSIQAVCHTLAILLWTLPTRATLQSGLFRHTCPEPSCGRRMQLGPLHTLVVITLFLATYGCAGEDLLGMIACYLCMITGGVDPLERACLSMPQILGFSTDDTCTHADMTPFELAVELRRGISQVPFTNAVTVGWNCLLTIMRIAESAKRLQTDGTMSPGTNDSDNSSGFGNEESPITAEANDLIDAENYRMHYDQDKVHTGSREQHALCEIEFRGVCHECDDREMDEESSWVFDQSSGLGHAWAVIQAEVANYRPLTEGDNWSSPHFSVEDLLQSMTKNGSMNIAYIKDKMLKPYCSCGRYLDAFFLAIRQDMFEQHCTNMDGSHETWERTSFIGRPAF